MIEDLKERTFFSEEKRLPDKELVTLLVKSFLEPDYSFESGESNKECQVRAVNVLKELLFTYKEKKVVIGTHGAVMTLMMGFYDNKYDLEFLHSTSKPDIYKMEFNGQKLLNVQRLWKG